MTPEEIKEITDLVVSAIPEDGASNGPIYILISIIVTAAPIVFRYFKKAFVKEIEAVVQGYMKQTDDMFKIMNMHIEELVHVKGEVAEQKEKVEEVKKTVEKHSSILAKLKEKC